jgi:ABC-2 type transport system ATP-binding protein
MSTALAHEDIQTPRELTDSAPVAVSVRNLSKRFKVRRPFKEVLSRPFHVEYAKALNDVSCEIRKGEFFGFLGANGAGKTTLFKTLSTLVIPDQGSVSVEGYDVVKQAADVRRILTPVIADERSLRWRLSSRENLRLFAILYEVPQSQVNTRVDEVLDTVGLDPGDPKMVGRYSSGMRQRLLIARALISHPRVLLLDEPTRSLDPVSARALRNFLKQEICRKLGCTVLLATHTSEEAFELCDRVAILDRGQIVAVGATDQLVMKVTEERYRLWTRTTGDEELQSLVRRGVVSALALRGIDEEGWVKWDLDIPAGIDSAADAVKYLVQHGVTVARFERIGISLGELIQRVTAREGAGGTRA